MPAHRHGSTTWTPGLAALTMALFSLTLTWLLPACSPAPSSSSDTRSSSGETQTASSTSQTATSRNPASGDATQGNGDNSQEGPANAEPQQPSIYPLPTTPPPAATPAPAVAVQPPSNSSGTTAAPMTTTPNQTAASTMTQVQSICLNTINQYRATLGRKALIWRADKSACADSQIALDGKAGIAHKNFATCGELAQDECPGWPATPEVQLPKCLAQMWAEGPGGGHYENMSNAAYTQVSCGVAQVNGGYWMVQNFYP